MMPLVIFLLVIVASFWSSARLWQDREMTVKQRIGLFLFLFIVWFFPFLCLITGYELPIVYSFCYHVMSFLFIWAFLFFVIHVVQDIIWCLIWLVNCFKHNRQVFYWKRPLTIHNSNAMWLITALVLTCFALYSGLKAPEVRELKIYTSKINSNVTIVALSDMHLHHSLSMKRLNKIIDKVNDINPDVIVFLGDLADEKTNNLHQQLFEISQLKAPLGKYAVSGNHDFRVGHEDVKESYREADATYLFNEGVEVAPHLYIAGIPDYRSVRSISDAADVLKALSSAQNSDYKILLSHRPDFIDTLVPGQIDLQLSGHTHGGQIFPQHFIVKMLNGYLYGLYRTANGKLYVSRGTGQFGAQMRLFAPTEITVIRLIAEAKQFPQESVSSVKSVKSNSENAFVSPVSEEQAVLDVKQDIQEPRQKMEDNAKTDGVDLSAKTFFEQSKEKAQQASIDVLSTVKEILWSDTPDTLEESKAEELNDENQSKAKQKSVQKSRKKLLLPIIPSVIKKTPSSKSKSEAELKEEFEKAEITKEIDELIASIQNGKDETDNSSEKDLKAAASDLFQAEPAVKKEMFVRQEDMFVEAAKDENGHISSVRIYNAHHKLIADTDLSEGKNVLTYTVENQDGSKEIQEIVLHVYTTPNTHVTRRSINSTAKTIDQTNETTIKGGSVKTPATDFKETNKGNPSSMKEGRAASEQQLMPVPIAWQPIYGLPEGGQMMPMYPPVMGYYPVPMQQQ